MNTLFSSQHSPQKGSSAKAVLTLSAVAAVAGIVALQANRTIRRLRKTHLDFDFPIEEQLFIG